MILPAILRRPRLIDQFARPLPPLLTALFEDSGVCALVLDRDCRVVRANRGLDALLAMGGTHLATDGAGAGRAEGVHAGTSWVATDGTAVDAPALGSPVEPPTLAAPVETPALGAPVGALVGTPSLGAPAGTPSLRAAVGALAETLFALADRQRIAAVLVAALRGDPLPPLQVRLNAAGSAAAAAVALSVAPLRESDGAISGLLLRLTDLSVEKRLEAELAQLQKMQAVGQLAGGIAHDFNNLLTAICAAADSVLERESCEAATLDDVRQIRQSADRGAALVRQLLAFGRRQPLMPAVVPVNAAVRNLSDLLTRLLGEQVRLRLELEEPGRSVRVDPSQLDQVLVNLAVNARDAMPGGGTLTLRTGHLTLYQPQRVGPDTMPPGRYVAIGVEDTGEGIPPATLPLVFEPFFTTRRERGGNGLGLSTVQGIVRQSGGFVTVESVVGRGTCVSFWLPRHEAAEVVSGTTLWEVSPQAGVPEVEVPQVGVPEAEVPQVEIPEADVASSNGRPPADRHPDVLRPDGPRNGAPPIRADFSQTPAMTGGPPAKTTEQEHYILLVEDEEAVRRLTERALRRAGWQVLAVDSAESALDLLPHPGGLTGPPSVLLSDIILPGIDGTELARAARAIWPALPIVLVSGYTDSALLGDLVAQGVAFLTKPFRLRELVACVERAAGGNGEEVSAAAGGARHVRD
jgi:two-component system cell cycle sensor histidine kinase/response regulator CckA